MRIGRVSWLVPAGGAVAAWQRTSHPGHWYGLAVLAGLFLVLWPVVVVAVVYGLPDIFRWLLVPRSWRAWWRHSRTRVLVRRWLLGKGPGRASVPRWLWRATMEAGRWRCLWCGSRLELEVDHILAYSLGGPLSLWNTAVLCGPCNRAKCACWRYRSGHVYFKRWSGPGEVTRPPAGWTARDLALAILDAEKLARFSLLRWLRAAAALRIL